MRSPRCLPRSRRRLPSRIRREEGRDAPADPALAEQLAEPLPGSPMLFETTVRSVASDCSASASMSVSGAPTSPNPPTMIVSPERMWETASSALIVPRTVISALSAVRASREAWPPRRRPRPAGARREVLAFDVTDVPHVTRMVRAPHRRPSAMSIPTSSPITAICPVGTPSRSLTASTAAWGLADDGHLRARDLGERGGHHRAAAEDRTVEPRVVRRVAAREAGAVQQRTSRAFQLREVDDVLVRDEHHADVGHVVAGQCDARFRECPPRRR